MLITILIVIAAVVILLLLFVAMQPSDFRVSRSATISALPESVFAQVNDFHKWEAWNPWGKLDPEMKTTYEGASSGVGTIYTWSGNSKAGEGRMTITESRPGSLVRIRLEFLKPFQATNSAEFTFEPQGSQTVITWSMTGTKNFMMKGVHLMMNMDKMIGGEFEKGLAQIKAIVESPSKS